MMSQEQPSANAELQAPALPCSNSSLIAAEAPCVLAKGHQLQLEAQFTTRFITTSWTKLIIPSSRIHHRALQSPIELYGGRSTQGTEVRVDETHNNDSCSNAQPWKSLVTEHQPKFWEEFSNGKHETWADSGHGNKLKAPYFMLHPYAPLSTCSSKVHNMTP